MTKDDIRRSPGDFLYALLSNNDILTIASVLDPDKANIIQHKRLRQIKLLKGAYNGTPDYTELNNWIKEAYGCSYDQVFIRLLSGESVAGKDWKNGVYGVGKILGSTFNNGSNYSVDEETGRILDANKNTVDSIPIFANDPKGNTYVSGYSCIGEGVSYTSLRSDNGKYYANTYGTDKGAWYADGSAYTVSKSSSFWEGLSTYYPLVKSIIDMLLDFIYKMFGTKKDDNGNQIKPENTVPKQDEFMIESSRKSMIPLLALALAGGYLILKPKKG